MMGLFDLLTKKKKKDGGSRNGGDETGDDNGGFVNLEAGLENSVMQMSGNLGNQRRLVGEKMWKSNVSCEIPFEDNCVFVPRETVMKENWEWDDVGNPKQVVGAVNADGGGQPVQGGIGDHGRLPYSNTVAHPNSNMPAAATAAAAGGGGGQPVHGGIDGHGRLPYSDAGTHPNSNMPAAAGGGGQPVQGGIGDHGRLPYSDTGTHPSSNMPAAASGGGRNSSKKLSADALPFIPKSDPRCPSQHKTDPRYPFQNQTYYGYPYQHHTGSDSGLPQYTIPPQYVPTATVYCPTRGIGTLGQYKSVPTNLEEQARQPVPYNPNSAALSRPGNRVDVEEDPMERRRDG